MNLQGKKIWIAISGIFIICVVLIYLYSTGLFNIEKRVKSPDGKTTTTIYNCDISEFPFPKQAFTIEDKGSIGGRTIMSNAKFNDLWWSPDSKYRLISLEYEKEGKYYTLNDFTNHSSTNLLVLLNSGLYEKEELKSIIKKDVDDYVTINYIFDGWTDVSGEMKFKFDFVGNDGLEHTGSFKYSRLNGSMSDFEVN